MLSTTQPMCIACLSIYLVHGLRTSLKEAGTDIESTVYDAREAKAEVQTSIAIHGDLSKLHSSYYVEYDVQKTVAWNAREAFQHFARQSIAESPNTHLEGIFEDAAPIAFWANVDKEVEPNELLTVTELTNFEARVVESVEEQAARSHLQQLSDKTARDGLWRAVLGKALEDQKPLVTENLVSRINGLNLGWEAQSTVELQNMSMRDGRALTGLFWEIDEESDADVENMSQMPPSVVQLGEPFDSHLKWPQCRAVLAHTRSQGQCGSCWAQSAAYVLETRLCIATNGAITGPMAWLSSEYLASCSGVPWGAMGRFFGLKAGDGCAGGDARVAFDWAIRNGVPTGGPRDGLFGAGHTCVPYGIGGNSLLHFQPEKNHKTPPCPTSCTNKHYLRSLDEDLYKLHFQHYLFHDHDRAKRTIAEGGPIIFDFTVYNDFHAYRKGTYKPMSRKRKEISGYHSTACFGYGPRYLYCKNSWGSSWGSLNGNFKINPKPVIWRYRSVGAIDIGKSVIPEVHGRLRVWRQWLFGF